MTRELREGRMGEDGPTNGMAQADPSSRSRTGTQALIRGLRIVESLAVKEQPIGVGDLARELDLPKSTVQRLLKTLQQEQWVESLDTPTTRWQLSARLFTLARRNAPSRRLRDVALPYLRRLGELTRETIHFSVSGGSDRLVLIERIDSDQAVRTFNPIGAFGGMHTSASGKAWLAMLTDDEITSVLSRPLRRATENSILDPDTLLDQVAEIRERGYAVNIAENRAGVCSIGAAVRGPDSRPIAALAISIPQSRFNPAHVPEWGEAAHQAAQSISEALIE